jgi:hypothetical protein
MSSKKYEQLMNYVINEDIERAEALFHEIVVETSRKIYEDVMEMDDIDEGMDTDLMQEIESEEQNSMQMDEDEETEFTDTEEMDGDFEPTDDQPMSSMGGDDEGMGSGEPATKDDIMDIKDMLDEIMAAFEADDDMDAEEGEEEEEEGEDDILAGAEEEDEGEEEEEEGEDDELDAMMEAIELKKVSVTHHDGSDGSSKRSSVPANSGKSGMDGAPVKFSGGGEEKGRTAPKTESMKGGQSHYQNSPGGAKGVKGGSGESAKKPVTKDDSSNKHSPVAESRKTVKRRI